MSKKLYKSTALDANAMGKTKLDQTSNLAVADDPKGARDATSTSTTPVESTTNAEGARPKAKLKYFVVRLGTATVDGLDHRCSYRRALYEARTAKEAEQSAMEDHCPEAFEIEYDDNDEPVGSEPGSGRGVWTTWDNHRAFQLGERSSTVDQGCVFWVEVIAETTESEARVLKKYL